MLMLTPALNIKFEGEKTRNAVSPFYTTTVRNILWGSDGNEFLEVLKSIVDVPTHVGLQVTTLILEWVLKKVLPVFQVSSFDKNSRQKLILKSEKSCLILFFIKPVPESLLASCLTKSDAPKKSFYTLS